MSMNFTPSKHNDSDIRDLNTGPLCGIKTSKDVLASLATASICQF